MPVLALGGTAPGGEDWKLRVAVPAGSGRQGGMVDNCGHWMPEEQPDELLRRLLEFFGRPVKDGGAGRCCGAGPEIQLAAATVQNAASLGLWPVLS